MTPARDRDLDHDHERAFAKVNLCLFLGDTRADGRHELVTLFEAVGLVDDLIITPLPAGAGDEVICEGVAGPNLVADALGGLRTAGWSAPPVRVEIRKRIPVAAGMGGGSADAAAMLRCAPRLARIEPPALERIAAALGADVPSQLDPGPSLGTGAGEIVEPVLVDDHSLLVLPQPSALSTADVYREADRLGLARPAAQLASLHADLARAPRLLAPELVVNDLEPASVSLCPPIHDAIALALDAGADQAIVCGSGPTVIGIFWGSDEFGRAQAAARRLADRFSGALAVDPVARGTPARAPNE